MSIASDLGAVYTRLSAVLSACGTALTRKGQTAPETLEGIAAKISAIQTGTDTSDATATAADILAGKTAYGSAGKLTGTYEPPDAYYQAAMEKSALGSNIYASIPQNPSFIMFTVTGATATYPQGIPTLIALTATRYETEWTVQQLFTVNETNFSAINNKYNTPKISYVQQRLQITSGTTELNLCPGTLIYHL